MIPKIIHYCWFGGPKPEIVLRCIKSWREHCPNYEIKEWNETNANIEQHPFTKKMYAEKHYAFVADYVRLVALEHEGGIYLDTDMLLTKSLDGLLDHDIFLGEEAPGMINVAAMGAVPSHCFTIACRRFYDEHMTERITIPKVVTSLYQQLPDKQHVFVLPPIAFYPFSPSTIKEFTGQDLGPMNYGVHLWNYSWGHPLNKFFMRVGIYETGKKIAEKLHMKSLLKKLLGFV